MYPCHVSQLNSEPLYFLLPNLLLIPHTVCSIKLGVHIVSGNSYFLCAEKKTEKRSSASEDEAGYMDRFVDVVLSLLAYSSAELPSAPLREAIEALFRAFASRLTKTGKK